MTFNPKLSSGGNAPRKQAQGAEGTHIPIPCPLPFVNLLPFHRTTLWTEVCLHLEVFYYFTRGDGNRYPLLAPSRKPMSNQRKDSTQVRLWGTDGCPGFPAAGGVAQTSQKSPTIAASWSSSSSQSSTPSTRQDPTQPEGGREWRTNPR